MKLIRTAQTDAASVFAAETASGQFRAIDGDLFGTWTITERPVTPTRVLAPVNPRAIVCIGLNYRAHAVESGSQLPDHPMVFMKMPSAVIGPGDPIVLPRKLASSKVDFEGELAVIIGKPCLNATPENALDHVLGYCCANDVSARDWQKDWGGGQFCRGKTFRTFCPLGPAIVPASALPDPQTLRLRTFLNGQLMQDSSTADMIFSVRDLIVFLSGSTLLEPGTVILTGTPSGVGMAHTPPVFLQPGDTISIQIDGIGELENPVEEETL